jgi:two-component system phosphate regulon sensor histidine kinase PhoR
MRSSGAGLVAVLSASVAGILAVIAVLVGNQVLFSTWFVFVVFILVFTLIFLLVYFLLQGFIRQKITPLYQIMHGTERKDNIRGNVAANRTSLGQVSQDVINWVVSRNRDIARLKEMEKYRREFLGNVSHELKTPIFNIQGYVLTLLDGGLEDPSINRLYLEKTEKASTE